MEKCIFRLFLGVLIFTIANMMMQPKEVKINKPSQLSTLTKHSSKLRNSAIGATVGGLGAGIMAVAVGGFGLAVCGTGVGIPAGTTLIALAVSTGAVAGGIAGAATGTTNLKPQLSQGFIEIRHVVAEPSSLKYGIILLFIYSIVLASCSLIEMFNIIRNKKDVK